MRNWFLSGLLLASTAVSIFPNDQQEQVKPQWKEFFKNYVTSITAGGTIGALTGFLSAKAFSPIVKTFTQGMKDTSPLALAVCIVTLCAENALRHNLIDATSDNFREYSIRHHAGLTNDIAWLTSWIAFLTSLTLNPLK